MRKRLFLMTLCLLLLAACGGGRRYDMLMHEADSLLTAGDAATAYALLAAADSQKTAWSRRERMAYELQKAQAQNLAYVDFRTDSVLRIVARFYDSHGTPNDRLRAHYLLGCAYRDLHEAPLAILSWEDAIAAADTLSPTCDYATLFRVYGQMAGVYFRQLMPEQELEARGRLCHYALLAGDTLNYIRGLLKKNDAYLQFGDTASIFQNIQHVRQLYLERGLTAEAARVYPTAISLALDVEQFDSAHAMMQVFESESGLFDERGNIARGYEQYYYQKGRYLMAIEQVDSAEYYFHRILSIRLLDIDGYRGMLYVFKYKGQTDSILKYNQLYENALVEYLNNTKTNAVTQAEGMYDYQRHERIAQEQKERAYGFKLALISVVAIGIIIAMLAIWFFQKKREEKLKLMELYSSALADLNKTRQDCKLLQQSLSKTEITKKLLTEREVQIQQLEIMVKKLRKQIDKSANLVLQQKLEESEIVKKFQAIAHDSYDSTDELKKIIKARAATKKEWKSMTDTLQISHPALYLLIHKHNLSELKQKVCILSYLGFDTPTIATLINAQPGSISNARTALARELFNLTSAHELNSCLRDI